MPCLTLTTLKYMGINHGDQMGFFLFKISINVLVITCRIFEYLWGGGPRVVVSTAAFHARVRGSVPGLGGLKETKCFFPIHV